MWHGKLQPSAPSYRTTPLSRTGGHETHARNQLFAAVRLWPISAFRSIAINHEGTIVALMGGVSACVYAETPPCSLK